MIKTKKSKDFTETTLLVYNSLTKKYGFSARLSDIWDLLRDAFSIDDFDILDTRFIDVVKLQNYLIKVQRDWQAGLDVDFGEFAKTLLEIGDFSRGEKTMFTDGAIEERLWGILLAVTRPREDLKVENL